MHDKEQLYKILLHALVDTMNTMAFVDVLPASQYPEEKRIEISFAGTMLWSALKIDSPYFTELEILTSPSFAKKLTETLYTDSVRMDEQQLALDTIAELLNTIAGKFMLSLSIEKKEFSLGLPDKGHKGYFLPDNAIVCECIADDKYPVTVVLHIKEH